MWEEEGGGGGTYGFFCRKITKMSQVENTSKDPARSLFFLFWLSAKEYHSAPSLQVEISSNEAQRCFKVTISSPPWSRIAIVFQHACRPELWKAYAKSYGKVTVSEARCTNISWWVALKELLGRIHSAGHSSQVNIVPRKPKSSFPFGQESPHLSSMKIGCVTEGMPSMVFLERIHLTDHSSHGNIASSQNKETQLSLTSGGVW